MAILKTYIATEGPVMYDDTDLIDDPDGDFAGLFQYGFITNGKSYVGTAPTASGEVARIDEITSTSSDAESFAYFMGIMNG